MKLFNYFRYIDVEVVKFIDDKYAVRFKRRFTNTYCYFSKNFQGRYYCNLLEIRSFCLFESYTDAISHCLDLKYLRTAKVVWRG